MVARIVLTAPILTSLAWKGAAKAEPMVTAVVMVVKNFMLTDEGFCYKDSESRLFEND
jgi:hypothetical protein